MPPSVLTRVYHFHLTINWLRTKTTLTQLHFASKEGGVRKAIVQGNEKVVGTMLFATELKIVPWGTLVGGWVTGKDEITEMTAAKSSEAEEAEEMRAEETMVDGVRAEETMVREVMVEDLMVEERRDEEEVDVEEVVIGVLVSVAAVGAEDVDNDE